MTNSERLVMEINGITLTPAEIQVYLAENGMVDTAVYDPSNKSNTIAIYVTALAVLESIANNPDHMKSRKFDDMSIDKFAENLQARIDQLDKKVRKLKFDVDTAAQTNYFSLFQE